MDDATASSLTDLTDRVSKVSTEIEAIDAKVERVERDLSAKIAEIKPPGFWRLVMLAAAVVVTLGGIIWQVGERMADLARSSALLAQDLAAVHRTLESLQISDREQSAKLDQLILRVLK